MLKFALHLAHFFHEEGKFSIDVLHGEFGFFGFFRFDRHYLPFGPSVVCDPSVGFLGSGSDTTLSDTLDMGPI